jgi:hypothetical protein
VLHLWPHRSTHSARVTPESAETPGVGHAPYDGPPPHGCSRTR